MNKLFNKLNFLQLLKYVLVGLTGFIVEFSLFNILYSILDENYTIYIFILKSESISHTIGLISGAIICFILNKIWSFNSKGKSLKISLKYLLVFTLNLIITNILLLYLTNELNFLPQLAKLIIMCITTSWNFIIYKYFVYK